MKTKTINLYTLDEMRAQFPKVYQKILDRYRDFNVDGCYKDEAMNWYGYTMEFYREHLEKIGFSGIKFSFSGFSCQGDGASFTANYVAPKEFPELSEECPESIKRLADVLKGYNAEFPGLYFSITRDSNRYSHENTVSIDRILMETGELEESSKYYAIYLDTQESCRDAMREYYRALEKDYDSLTSDENVSEALEANEYYFDDTGEIVNPDE